MSYLARAFWLAAAYYLAGRCALLLAIPPGYATAVWPAAGLALAGMLHWGRSVAPAVWIGSFFINLHLSFDGTTLETTAQTVSVSLAIGAGSALEAVVGAWLVKRWIDWPTALEKQRDVLVLIGIGGPAACVISATIAVGTLAISGIVEWGDAPFSWLTWWAGDAIGVVVITPLAVLLQARPLPTWRRIAAVGLPLVTGFAIATGFFVVVSDWELHREKDVFRRRSVSLAHAIEARLRAHEEAVVTVSGLFAASISVTRTEFRIYVEPLLARNPEIQALGWNPLVRDADRARFEQDARSHGINGAIAELGADGTLHQAGRRDFYVPVSYLEPSDPNQRAFGFDIASDPARRSALERARTTGNPTATAGLTLIQEPIGTPGVLLVVPMKQQGEVRGYAVGVLQVAKVAAAGLARSAIDEVELAIIDHSAVPSTILYRSDDYQETPWWSGELTFGGRHWRIDCWPSRRFAIDSRSWAAWTALAGALFFVGLLSALVLITTGHASQAEREALVATQAEARYRALYEYTPDLHATLSPDQGLILACNQRFADMLGYSKLDLLGRRAHDIHDGTSATAFETALHTFRTTGELTDTSLVLRRNDGTVLDASLRISAVRGERGEVLNGLGVWRDISNRRDAERTQQLLLELSDVANQAASVETVQLAVATRLGEQLGASRCIFFEVDPESDEARVHHDYHHGLPSLAGTATPIARFSPDTQERIRAGDAVINHDARTDPRTKALFDVTYGPMAIIAYIAVPLFREGVWRAVFLVSRHEPHIWRPAETSLVQTVAEKAWLWIEQIRIGELRAHNEGLERLVEERTRHLNAALGEREVLLKEVHHRVKNNLQVISSLLGLQAHHVTDPQAREVFAESRARVHAIALVHENLYQKRDLARVEFDSYVRTLTENLLAAYDGTGRGITLELSASGAKLPVTVAIPCGLIISELVTNALKHAFPDGRTGGLSVALLVEAEDRVTLTVADDGVGMPTDLDPRATQSLGLELVFAFAAQLHADVSIERDAGTRFRLSFSCETSA